MRTEMYRHNRDKNGNPISTLATIREGDIINFGIARCNAKDNFIKKMGRLISMKRAKLAQSGEKIFTDEKAPLFYVSKNNGLYGRCHVDSVGSLLDYFRGL